jgi:prepilin-type N-terminal cleavage/methylation domain-containing protein
LKHLGLSTRGFTLIELLIVIAIILILIAIALPNFLEAQIRAKVTQAMGNTRTIETAMESYYLDFNLYPTDHEPDALDSWHGLFQLTSPLRYLPSIPVDPFSTTSGLLDPTIAEIGWELASTGNVPYIVPFQATQNGSNVHAWALDSSGPDTGSGLGGGSAGSDEFYGNIDWPFLGKTLTCPSLLGWMTYSPTNGSKSKGDIVRVGGQHRSGRYCIDNWFLVKGVYPAHIR